MSIVDTWDWDKLDTSDYDKEDKMTADMKAFIALREFEERYGVRPNRIIMGYKFVNELSAICADRRFEQIDKEVHGIVGRYEGIPFNVDYVNPDILEVGYMEKWTEEMY